MSKQETWSLRDKPGHHRLLLSFLPIISILIFSLKDVKYHFYLLLNCLWVSENILVNWKKDQINNIQIRKGGWITRFSLKVSFLYKNWVFCIELYLYCICILYLEEWNRTSLHRLWCYFMKFEYFYSK